MFSKESALICDDIGQVTPSDWNEYVTSTETPSSPTSQTSTQAKARALVSRLPGTRQDWRLYRPSAPRFAPQRSWIGSIMVAVSVLVGWFAFSGATGDGNVSLGLFVGAAAIQLMAWSFLLAVRIKWLQPLFGGLDSMYRVHRWCGSLAVAAMLMHTQIEPEIKNGIRGASRDLKNSAEDLAGLGETAIYVLVGISLLRLIPYRFWRLTHKLLGIPFLFACAHFFTATKPYANGSPWGIWFGLFMAGGTVAYLWRVIVNDMIRRGARYKIVSTRRVGNNTELQLEPSGRRRIDHRVGQFAILRVLRRGLSEPHPFTIASHPDEDQLVFIIRDLGDWTDKIGALDLTGEAVEIEGPFGRFEPFGEPDQTHVWVAGGVGITPFLSALPTDRRPHDVVPHVFYAVKSQADAPGLDRLQEAAAGGHIRLHVYDSSAGQRLSVDVIANIVGAVNIVGAHVALCGPAGLVRAVRQGTADLGARSIEVEDFDFRQGFGPELSREVDDLVTSVARR